MDGVMPSVSPKQGRTMRAIAHGWVPPAGSGIHIPLSVAQDFAQADERIRERRTAGRLQSMLYSGPERRRGY